MLYVVVAPADAVVISMAGLQALYHRLPQGAAKTHLHAALFDWDSYGSDDEVLIDVTKGARIANAVLLTPDMLDLT